MMLRHRKRRSAGLSGRNYVMIRVIVNIVRGDRVSGLHKEEQQRVAVGPGNAHCMSIRQVSLRCGTCGHYSVARRC